MSGAAEPIPWAFLRLDRDSEPVVDVMDANGQWVGRYYVTCGPGIRVEREAPPSDQATDPGDEP